MTDDAVIARRQVTLAAADKVYVALISGGVNLDAKEVQTLLRSSAEKLFGKNSDDWPTDSDEYKNLFEAAYMEVYKQTCVRLYRMAFTAASVQQDMYAAILYAQESDKKEESDA